MRITFIRHTSVDVPPGTCYGQTDVPLKPTFREEASAVKGQLKGKEFDAVFTSPLSRCTRLADACGYTNAIRDYRLKELNFGEWEMKTYDEIDDPRLQEWFEDYFNVAPTGGESFKDQRDRLQEFIKEVKGSGYDSVAVFAHGGILLQAMLMAGVITPEETFKRQPPYGGVIELEF
ncbi:MAG: alpha-ribazole phosphatase [Duncaniella sp.]|nr:alpha-ribazole phosphatase [Muribaculum sp.]MCM1256071.1 alpha-ribazole phosphatase [Duncaniella sp.]